MDKNEIVEVLKEIADLLKLKDANPFKVRAYENGARTLEGTPDELGTLIENEELEELEGIGDALAEKITTLFETGELEYYENLKSEVPTGLMEMLEIPGLGPKKIQDLYNELELTTLDELEEACENEAVQELKGFGAKTEEKIQSGISHIRSYQDRYRIDQALEDATPVYQGVEEHPSVRRCELAGSLRRHNETVGDVDILASVSESEREEVMNEFVQHASVQEVIGRGTTKASVRVDEGLQVDLRLVSEEEYPFALHYFTGSKEHNVAMRSLAQDQNRVLNEYGLFEEDSEERISCSDETELFQALGRSYIPPELREGFGELEEARKEAPFSDLVTRDDVRGIFHVHTPWSDGRAPTEKLIESCLERGFDYLGFSDHSQSASYAGGLTVDEIKQQKEELNDLQERYSDIHLFHGIESDIRKNGSLDYPEEVLETFDFVIASVHQHFQLSEEEQTRRLVKAVEHPFTTMLGHPTGRRLQKREPYKLDQERVIEAAGEHNTIIEINANPQRLDLSWTYGKKARDCSVLTSINPDAHSIRGLDHLQFGVGVARKGGWRKQDVINTWALEEVRAFLSGE